MSFVAQLLVMYCVNAWSSWSVRCVCVCVCIASSEELIVLTQSLLSLDWLNHTKYGPLCCLVPHVGASVCLQLCPTLPLLVLSAFAQQSLTTPVCPSVCLSTCQLSSNYLRKTLL